MIEKTTAYRVGQMVFGCIEEAQEHELAELFPSKKDLEGPALTRNEIAVIILTNQEKVIDILTTTPASKVKARKINGGTKKRKAKPIPEAVNAVLPDLDQ